MDELMISGRRFLSAARAAKEHGYHSDYIGQLIRAGKVKGQKVGRAWYVDAESLAIYLGKNVSQAIVEHEEKKKETSPEHEIALSEGRMQDEKAFESDGPATSISIDEGGKKDIASPILRRHEIEAAKGDRDEGAVKININRPREEGNLVVSKDGGLSYLEEDPLLPEIRKERIVYREPEAVITVEPNTDESPSVRHGGYALQGAALFGIAVFVLVAVTALSSLFVFTMTVGPSEAAGVHFSLPK